MMAYFTDASLGLDELTYLNKMADKLETTLKKYWIKLSTG